MRTMTFVSGAVVSALFASGCSGEESNDDTTTQVPTIPSAGDTGTTTDTGTPFVDPLEVAAIGWELKAGWNQELNQLEGWLNPDINGTNGGQPWGSVPYVLVTLANLEYFQGAPGSTPDPDNYCEVLAFFDYIATSQVGEEFNYDSGFGGTGTELPTLAFFEGVLRFIPETADERCSELDSDVFPGADPYELMEGMRFGVGFGALSPYLLETATQAWADDGQDFADDDQAYLTQFIAVNHDDGSGGVSFPAYDWNTAFYVETDYTQCINATYTSTTFTYEYCGLVQIDETDPANPVYVSGDTTVGPVHGYMSGGSWWLEDTPNLDLSLLKEDAIAF